MDEGSFASELYDQLGSKSVIVKPITGSTNNDLKRLAQEGAPEGTVEVALSQTAGKGRLGRSFYSPPGTGIYMSVLLRPERVEPGLLTAASACAVCESIEEVFGIECMIKWVNDLYLGSGKVCGILAESAFSGQKLECTVVGIGVNLSDPPGGFPEDIKNKACSLLGSKTASAGQTARLAKGIYDRLLGYYRALPARDFLGLYRQRSLLTGRTVSFVRAGKRETAKAVGIDDFARLVVEGENGRTAISEGEVTIEDISRLFS